MDRIIIYAIAAATIVALLYLLCPFLH